jgi:hypothetical protein
MSPAHPHLALPLPVATAPGIPSSAGESSLPMPAPPPPLPSPPRTYHLCPTPPEGCLVVRAFFRQYLRNVIYIVYSAVTGGERISDGMLDARLCSSRGLELCDSLSSKRRACSFLPPSLPPSLPPFLPSSLPTWAHHAVPNAITSDSMWKESACRAMELSRGHGGDGGGANSYIYNPNRQISAFNISISPSRPQHARASLPPSLPPSGLTR